MGDPVVTRFAPSPTGHLHIGGARTALFNWALAQGRGSFVLRIEDTDRLRSSEDAARGILEDLAWLGIGWDEGPAFDGLGGDPRGVGPFYQKERVALYDRAVEELVERDLAYPAFESPDELDALRRAAQAEKRAFRYRRAPDWDREAALHRMRSEEYVVRFRMPEDPVRVVDAVIGEIEFGEEHLDDFIVRKRDGFPTFHLAVVVDDDRMGVTHVLRGQEHLNNTPRHVALQRALGLRTPVYAHLPLIFNPDGSKMSKRDKDKAARAAFRALSDAERAELDLDVGVEPAALARWQKEKRSQLEPEALGRLAARLELELPCVEVEDFRRAGFLPEVLCNYLALLGWSPGTKDAEGRDLERFDRDFLAAHFALDRIGRSNAKFDFEKLLAFNQDAQAALEPERFFEAWTGWCERYAEHALARSADWRRRFAAMIQSRCRTLADPTAAKGPGAFAWCADEALRWDAKAVSKFLGSAAALEALDAAADRLAGLEPFAPEAIDSAVKALAESRGVGMGKIAQPLRVAVTGSSASPPLGDTLAILGRAAVLARIRRCRAERAAG